MNLFQKAMDVKPVRVAGYLSKSELKKIKDFWCVIRDGNFYVYNMSTLQNQSHLSVSPGLDEVAVMTFPISHLSATAYVLPNTSKRTPTQFALQLDCAKSGRSSTFYAHHEWELESWVDGIKAESTADNIFPMGPNQRSLLPPNVEVSHQRRQSVELSQSRPQKAATETLRKADIVVEQSDSVFENIMKDSAPQKVLDKHVETPLLSEKNLKKTFMMRALPDLVVSSHRPSQSRSLIVESPFSSPSFSSRSSSRRSNYQDSADESSLASSVTSSPVLSGSGRFHTQTSGRAGDAANTGTNRITPMAVERKRLLTTQNQTRPDEYMERNRSPLTATEFGLDSSSPIFYVDSNVKNANSPHVGHPAKSFVGRRDKRHTITVVQEPADSGLQRYRYDLPLQNELTASSHRHSIAPLSSLDFQINQRKRNSKSQSAATISEVPYRSEKETIASDHISSSEDSDSSECITKASENIVTDDYTPQSFDDNFTGDDSLTDSLSESFSSLNEEMKPVLKKLKSRLHSTSETHQAIVPHSIPTDLLETDEELRRSSGSFGNRFLHRAKSLVGKRTKSIEHSNTSSILPIPAKHTSLPEDNETTTTKLPEPEPQTRVKSLTPVKRQPSTKSIQMEGWLYRRKTIKWGRMWAILYSEKSMSFFKEKKQSHNPHLKPLMTLDMKLGCDISNIFQDKNISTFDLAVKLPFDKVSQAEQFYADSTSPNKNDRTTSPAVAHSKHLHLMCKSTQEFVHWMKAFVMVNTSPSLAHQDPVSRQVLTLHRIKRSSTGDLIPDTKQCNTRIAGGHDTQINQSNVIPSPQVFRRIGARNIPSETNTYYPGVDVLEDFEILERPAYVKRKKFAKSRDGNLPEAATSASSSQISSVGGHKDVKNIMTSHIAKPAQAKTLQTPELDDVHQIKENNCKFSDGPVTEIIDTFASNLFNTLTDVTDIENQLTFNNSCYPKTDADLEKVVSAGLIDADRNLLFSDTRNKTVNSRTRETMEQSTSSNKLFRSYETTGPSISQTVVSGDKRPSLQKRPASVTYCDYRTTRIDELKQTSTVETYGLRRTNSDGNILEPCCNKPYRMRTFKKTVPELTETDFIEVYGLSNYKKDKYTSMDGVRLTTTSDNAAYHEKCCNFDVAGSTTDNQIFSHDPSCLAADSYVKNANVKRANSKLSSASGSSTDSKKSDGRSTRFRSITSTLRKKSVDSFRTKSVKSSKTTVCHVPASRLSNASHCGFLDRRNAKKQWERFWCVLQDSCLYCYNSPQSNVTRDTILLRGYDVIADVTNMNRHRFMFRLEQTGFPTLHFSNDNHQEYLLWVGTLEKETTIVASHRNGTDQHRSNSPALSVSGASSASLKSTDSNDDFVTEGNLTQSYSKERLDQELVEMQKHKLLKEIVTQQQQILEDQKQLSHKTSDAVSPPSTDHRAHQTVLRRNVVIDKYERARGAEEAKMTKHMTLLNRRRNSVQLKVDQLSREIAPTSGKKRRQNHQQFAALEAKLGEMRANLQKIDGEIHLLQTKKQNTIEKIRERQELELLLTEQQENLAIMRRHEQNSQFDLVNRRCHVPSRSRDAMTSIDELSSISDCCSSASSDSMNESKGVLRSMSTPRYSRTKRPETVKSFSTVSITSDEFGHVRDLSRSSDNDTAMSQYDSSSSLDGPIASSSLSSSSSSLPHRASNTVDPAIMADIEMFEKFSTMHLQKLQHQSPHHQ